MARFARPGHWNDPDQLEVGNAGLTSVEQRTQISLWAMTAAPLLISTDLRHVSASALNLLGNRQVIALDQDPLGRQARVVRSSGGLTSFVKPLADGSWAVAFFNETTLPKSVPVAVTALGLPRAPAYQLKNVWSGNLSHTRDGVINVRVIPHGTVVYRVSTG